MLFTESFIYATFAKKIKIICIPILLYGPRSLQSVSVIKDDRLEPNSVKTGYNVFSLFEILSHHRMELELLKEMKRKLKVVSEGEQKLV